MNNETVSLNQARARRIVGLMPELERRYQTLRAKLAAALADAGGVDGDSLALAQKDLESVVALIGDEPTAIERKPMLGRTPHTA